MEENEFTEIVSNQYGLNKSEIQAALNQVKYSLSTEGNLLREFVETGVPVLENLKDNNDRSKKIRPERQ
jgi:hypothetical protein